MSVGKLVPKGKNTIKDLVRGKEDAPIFLHITSSEQVVNLFEDKPPGYCILRLDPVFIEKWSRSPLLLTYKFGALLFTQILRVPHLRVKAAKKEILLCQCDKNSYSHIRSTAEFLPKLQSFIAEFVSNKNFVEKPLDSYSPDLKNELYYKKYLIFPANGTRLVLKKKKEDEVETAEAGIVFSNLSFFGKKGEDIKSISTFNEFLLEFLGMEEATEPQMKALGVSIQPSSRPAILSESSGANPSRLHIPSPRLLPMHGKAGKKGQFDVLAFTGKEKSAVIDRLKKAGEQTVDIADSGSSSTRSQRKYTDPREGLNTFLKELFDAVKVGQLANEKMDWIRRGLFDALVASGLIAEYTSDLQLDVPATSLSPPQKRDMLVGKILRHLLSNNPEGCREFVKLMGELLKKAREEETSEFPWGECVGLFTLLSVLIRSTEIEPFPTIFVQELGVNRMLEVYNDATNRIEADSAAEAEFQKALFKRMEEGAHRTAGGHGTSMLGTTESGTTTLNLGTSPPASYYIPVPPPPPPPLVIKRGKIRKMKKRFKTHKKDASKKDQLGDAKEADDEKERERENKEKENRERENREREEKEREIKEREIKEKEIKEKEEAESEKSKFKGVKLNTSVEFNTPRTSVDNSSPRPVIPALSLSATATKTKDEGLASAQSRFSRRRGINDETPRTPTSGRGSFGKELGRNTSFYITPSIQLTKLAFNLGETAVAADLTALMRYKTGGGNPDEPTDLSAEARNKRRSKRLSTSLSNLHNSLAIFKPGQLKPEASSFRSTAPYKIKTMILKALAKIIALPHLYAYVRSPVNLIFTELNKALASGLLKIDQPFRALLFSVLQPVADRVEYCHRIAWQQETRSMPIQRKMDFRRGLDKFLCRVHSQLCDALSRHDLADLELYLVMLGDYLHFCPTRVMASQVIDVTMETLLHIKYLVFNMVPESLTEDLRIQHVRLIHSLVRVFQELCAQTKHEGTLVFLLQLLLGTNETILFFRSYAKRIFFSEQTVQEISSHESKETLTEYRLQVIKLFSSLVSLVSAKLKYIEARRFPTSPLHLSGSSSLGLQQPHRVSSTEVDAVKEEEDSETAWCVSLMEQLGFLISPQTGYFMRFLGQGNHFSNFEVKKVMLQLFGQILMTPCNPFACNKAYTEFFISHHYLTFLKLYNSDGFDSSTLTLCALHLQILLCFAEHKTEKIKRKFYQLRIMDFLARQISLEYEIILKNAQYIESHARSPEPAAAMTQSSPNLGMADLRAQGVAQMQQSSSLPMLPLPRKTTGEVAQSSLATASTTIDPKRVTSTPALSPRKEPLKKAAKRKARAQSMSFTDSPLKLSLMSVTGVQPEDGSKRAELVSSSRAVMSQNRDTEPIIVSDRAQPKEDKKRNRMSGSFIRTSHRRIPSQNSGEQKSDWGMRSMPSWTRAKDSTVTPAAAAQATASGLSSSVSAAAGALSDANEVPEKKTFNQLKSSINMGSIGKKVGKAITLPGLKLGASLNKEAFAALAKESAESAQYSASDDDEDMLKPRVSIGSIVTMIPPTLRLSDSSSSHASTGTHSGQQITLEMTSSSTFNTASDLASDASRTETDDEDEQSSDDDSHRGPRSSVSSSSMSSSSGKLVIPGLKLSGAETKDGSSATGKGNVVIMKSPTEVKKTVIAIPGLKLTGAHTKDGSSAVGKGTTLLKSPTTAATSSRSGHDRADTDDEDEHTEEGTDADGDDEGSDRSESEREPESESDDSDEVAPKPVAKLAIPGLKLTGADTKDGSSAVGKGTVLTVKAASSSDSSSESESEDDAPPPVVAKIAIPGLKLTGADTKDGSTAVGRGTVLLKSTANTSQNSSLEDLRSPVRVAATTTRSVATPTVAAATAADSDSDASSSDSDDDAAAMPPPAPVSKLAIPGLKLTGADTKDGSSAVGKGTILSLKAAAPSISHDEPAPAAEGNTTSSDESESESDDGGEESKPQATAKFAIPGLKLTGADTKDGSSAVGKGTVLTVRTTMPSAGRGDSTSSDESESDEESRPQVTAKIAIPGLKLTGADTKDGSSAMGKGKVILKVGSLENFDTAFSDSSSDDSDSEAESEKPFKSPLPKMTAKLAIPGLKLTGADTKDGSSAVGKGTTLVVSTSAVSTTSVGASTQQRPVSPLAKEQQQQHSSSDSDSDDEAHTEATATDLSDSERSDRDESPRPSPSMRRSPLAIPGLKLTGSETKDGTSCVGKGTNLSRSAEFDVDQQRAPTEDHVKSVSPRSSVPGSPSRASPRLSPGSPTARPAIPSLKFPSTSAEAMPGMPGSPTRSGSGSSKEGKEGRKLIEIQERRRITPRTPKKPIMSTHPQTPKRPTGGSDGALPSPKPKVTFGGSDSGGGSDHGATSTSPRAAISLSPLSPNRSAALTIPSGAGGLEKSNSASFIPKLRFTEDLRQHNFKQEEFLKEALGEKPQKFPQLVVPAGGKTLSDIEHRILQSDPSLRFVKQSTNRRILEDIENLTGMLEDMEELSPEDIIERNQLYLSERNERKIYMDKALHITFLQLIFSLLLSPMGTLQPLYTDQFPVNNKKLNIPFLLHSHINHPANGPIIPELVERSLEMKEGAYRMLKLLTNRLFSPEQYQHMKRIAIGAYGTVYKCTVGSENLNVAVKLMELPKSIWDRCVLHDIFTEILVLDAYKDDKRICKLYDYGVSEEHYWVIMRFYRCSLKEWRLRQTRPFAENLMLYLNIFSRVLETMKICIKGDKFKINHFDLKCDNVLIDPIDPNIEEEELLNARGDKPPFNVCLADFGESTVYQSEDDGYTTRSRGTEFNKSPEMLNAAYANKKDDLQKYDRRKKTGCNKASDVWALGCLLYELLTGEFLFYDNDWVRFFIRVTYLGQELITAEKRAKIDNNPHLLRFFQWIFMRNPLMRPTLEDVIVKFQEMLNVMMPQLQENARLSLQLSPTSSVSSTSSAVDPRASMSMSGPMIFNNNNEEFLYSPTSRYHRHTLAHSLKTGDQRPGQATETDHYHEIMNKLTPYIFLGNESTHELNQLKFHYNITHIINCSEVANAHPQQFEYIQIASLKDIKLMEVIQFIHAAMDEQGKVLVSYHGRNSELAVGIVLAYLIEQHNLTYFEAFNLVKNRRYIIKPNPQLVAKVRASMTSTVKLPEPTNITADGTPELYIWDDKRKKDRKKKDKAKEKRGGDAIKDNPGNSADEVEHTAFNPLVFNRQIQERIRRNKEAGLDPLHVPVRRESKSKRSKPRLRRSSSADDVTAVPAKDVATLIAQELHNQSPGRKVSKEL